MDSSSLPALSDFIPRELSNAVLSAWLSGRSASCVPFLRPEHFPQPQDRTAWQAILQLDAEGIIGDLPALAERCKRLPTVVERDFEWVPYLLQVANDPNASSPMSFEENALTMYDGHRRFAAVLGAQQVVRDMYNLQKPLPPDPALIANRIQPLTVAEILSARVPAPRGPWKGVIPPGLTILGARPKSGKSVLMLQLATALGCGGMHFGQKVEPMKVLYYALEDKTGRLQDRMKKIGTQPGSALEFLFAIPPLYDQGLDEVIALMDRYGLIIIDTLERAMPRKDFVKDGKDFADVLGRLQSAALERNVSVVGIVHRRKQQMGSNGDPVDDVLGSTQLTTTADCVLAIYPDGKDGQRSPERSGGGKRTKRAQLLGRARDLEDIDLPMEFDRLTLTWQPVDAEQEEQEQERQQTEAQEAVLEAVRQLGKAKASSVADLLGMDRGNTSNRLAKLWKSGKVRMELIGNVAHYYLWEKLTNEINPIQSTHPTQGTQPTQATQPTQEAV